MKLASWLTLPALVGMSALLFLAAIAPQVHASANERDVLARIIELEGATRLDIRQAPSSQAAVSGSLTPLTFVWVDHCITDEMRSEWCLVERGGVAGWVMSHFIGVR